MGTAASKTDIGVSANPRVLYAEKLHKSEKHVFQIDTPVLVDMQHGTVRFREEDNTRNSKNREMPHEGAADLDKKKHYFYHTRLSQFGAGADKSKEDSFKFYYVTKGAPSTQGKRLHYVYGQGWNAKDSMRVKPTQTVERGADFAWPRRHGPNDLVYHVQHTDTIAEECGDGDLEENQLLEDLQSTPDRSNIRLKVQPDEKVSSVKARMAVKLIKSAENIFICHNETYFRNEDVLGDLRPLEERESAFSVQLTLAQ